MAYYDPHEERHPSAKDIVLNAENEALRGQLLSGIERVITSDFSFTVEIRDDNWERKAMSNPYPTLLARIAFLKFDGINFENSEKENDIFSDDEPNGPALPPLFQLGVVAEAHLLDKEKAVELSPEEIDALGLAWPDSLGVTLIDNTYANRINWSFSFQPNMRPRGFDFGGNKTGFVKTENPKTNPISLAYGIDSGMGSGATITEDGMDYLDDLRIMNQVLHKGTFDADTSANFARTAEQVSGLTLLNREIDVIRGSLPYFKRIIEGSLTSPSFRDMIAWRQYCEQRWGQKRL